LAPTYELVFGWLDRHLARKHEERLAAEIKLALRFLFAQRDGRIIPNAGVPFPPSFDYAFVTVAVENFVLRFSRGRGDLAVQLAPCFAPSDFHDLSLILGVVDENTEFHRESFPDLWAVGRAISARINALVELCSPEQFPNLKQRLESELYSWERAATKVAEAELNWRVYGPRR
jgi:hypothetical protein